MSREKETKKHPSYGMISISQIHSSSDIQLFGESVPTDTYYNIAIVRAEHERDLSHDRFFAARNPQRSDDELIEVSVTKNQLMDLLLNLNRGDGIPCTIKEFNGETVEQDKSFESRTKFHQRAYEKNLKDFAINLVREKKRVEQIVTKKNLTKEDQQELISLHHCMVQEITDNLPFFMKTYKEAAEVVMNEAKASFSNYVERRLLETGVEIKKDINLLDDVS